VSKTALTPTHVKIDVEGFEESVLRGGRRLLQSESAPLLFLELHNDMIRAGGRRPEAVLDLVDEFGYQTFDFQRVAIGRERLLAQRSRAFQAWNEQPEHEYLSLCRRLLRQLYSGTRLHGGRHGSGC